MCAVNYVKLFQVSSHHVRAYFWFIQLLMPQIVKLPDPKFHEFFQEALEAFADATPAEFFELVSYNATQFLLIGVMGWTAPDGIACARVSSLHISLEGDRRWNRLAELGWIRRNASSNFTG
jgi:hypothetical protein